MKNIYDKAFNINISGPRFNEANMLVVDLKVKKTKDFIKYEKLMKHKKFRVAKKNARKLAKLINANFYKGDDNKWIVEVINDNKRILRQHPKKGH